MDWTVGNYLLALLVGVVREYKGHLDAGPLRDQRAHDEQTHNRGDLGEAAQGVDADLRDNLNALFVAHLEAVPTGCRTQNG